MNTTFNGEYIRPMVRVCTITSCDRLLLVTSPGTTIDPLDEGEDYSNDMI